MSDVLTRRLPATLTPRTLDETAGTVDVVLSTGAPVRRAGFVERLALEPDNVTVASRVPLLDAHRQSSIGDIKGRVENVRHEAGAIVATLRVTDPAALAAIARGDVTGVSVGYRVTTWEDSRDAKTGERIRTATKWEILEVSLVPVPADNNAIIRSIGMEPEMTIEAPPEIVSETRAETNTQIRALATRMSLGTDFADGLIDREVTIEDARAAVLAETEKRGLVISTARVGPSGDDPAVIHARQAEAFACRMSGAEPSEAARPYMVLSLADAARDALTRAGTKGVGMLGREELLTRAMHTTSDFPNLLTGAGNRVLVPAYQAAQSPLKTLARQRNADDFRPVSLIKLRDFGRLKPVSEAGEIKALSTGEAAEGYSLETFGGLFNLSRKAIVNDDLGAFGRWAAMMGRAAADTEADQLAGLLLQSNGAGPTMGDGKRLFHVDHGNLGLAAAPDVDPLSDARLAMRRQKGLDGVSPISVVPKYLLVSADLETVAEKLLTTLAANTVADANPFSGKLTLLVEPRLPDGTWYVFADPSIMPVLEYAYLSSAPGPQLAARDGWDVLGREFRVILDFGCGAVEWRGAYSNPGVAL